MNLCNGRVSIIDDPEVGGRVILTFYPDNKPIHYSVSYWDLKELLEKSNSSIKLIDSKFTLTENHGN